MDDTIEGFLAWAEARRWSVRRHRSDAVLPAVILSRYPQAPESYCRFLRTAALLVTPDEAGWFNCKADFDGASDAAFKWNELETMSLQGAADDESWTGRVMRFWDTHLPIVLSVKSGYAFYAIDVDNGAVVRGDEPEFEEVRVVAASFPEFLTFIMAGRSRCSVA